MSNTHHWTEKQTKFQRRPTSRMLFPTGTELLEGGLLKGERRKNGETEKRVFVYDRTYVKEWIKVRFLRPLGVRNGKLLLKLFSEAMNEYLREKSDV